MKVTNASVESLSYGRTGNKADLRYDSEQRGFGVRLYPSGRKSFFLDYRNLHGTKKRITLGDYPTLSSAAARNLARMRLADVHRGHDPAADRKRLRAELTLSELSEKYLASVV